MKRTKEPSLSPNWNKRLLSSWEASHIPLDTWKIIHSLLGNDLCSVLALGRVNLALYTAFGGFEKHVDFAVARGYDEIIERARRSTLKGETLLHSLKWAVLTHGEYDDSLSLFQQLTFELDRAEPNVRPILATLDLTSTPLPVLAGGFIRVLMLRFLRRVGVKTPVEISERYSDIDIWINSECIARDEQLEQFLASFIKEPETARLQGSTPVRTFCENKWSEKPVQFILIGLPQNGGARSFVERLLYYFDFTCCQVAVTFREWDIGEVTLTPAFLYSLMTGCMFEGRSRPELPYPFRAPGLENDPSYYGATVTIKDKARLLSRFFKFKALGYQDPTLSNYDVAHMERIFDSSRVQSVLGEMRDDPTNYLFLERLYG
jgi:hypothetical protein